METIMVTGGLGFTDPQITKRLAAGGHLVVSYNRDFAPREDEIVMAQGELFDTPGADAPSSRHPTDRDTAALSHLTSSLEFPLVELSRGRRRPGYAVEIADVMPGLFNDLGLSSPPRRLCPAITARGLSDSIVSSAEIH